MKFSGGRRAGLGSESEVMNAPVTAKQGATVVAAATPREEERAPCGARQGLWCKARSSVSSCSICTDSNTVN